MNKLSKDMRFGKAIISFGVRVKSSQARDHVIY